jgi:hypothetical protein
MRWSRLTSLPEDVRELRASPHVAELFLFVVRLVGYDDNGGLSGTSVARRTLHILAQQLELALADVVTEDSSMLLHDDASQVTAKTKKMKVVRALCISRRFFSSKSRSIMTGPAGGLPGFADDTRDKGEGFAAQTKHVRLIS